MCAPPSSFAFSEIFLKMGPMSVLHWVGGFLSCAVSPCLPLSFTFTRPTPADARVLPPLVTGLTTSVRLAQDVLYIFYPQADLSPVLGY